MPDERDFRVRALLYIENQGVAQGLYNHVLGVKDDAVDINPNMPNAEPRKVEIGDAWIVEYDLCFPLEHEDVAIGLFNHTKNIPVIPLPGAGEGEETGFIWIERCGHRRRESCETIERKEVLD